jgi:hypothetical protein
LKKESKELAAETDELTKSIAVAAKAFAAVESALVTLKTKPDDPAANTALGLYRLAVEKDPAGAAPHLAKSNVPAIKSLGNVMSKADPPLVDLADALRDAARAITDNKDFQTTLYAEAAKAYQAALDKDPKRPDAPRIRLVLGQIAAATGVKPTPGTGMPTEKPKTAKAGEPIGLDDLDLTSVVGIMGGVITLSSAANGHIPSKETYSGPIEVTVVARTKGENIRLRAFGGAGVIFNWEVNPAELRVSRPDSPNPEQGTVVGVRTTPLVADRWYTLRWRVRTDGIDVAVDGKTVFTEKRKNDLSFASKVWVYAATTEVQVKGFAVKKLK